VEHDKIKQSRVTDYVSNDNAHVPVIGKMLIPGLLFTDDLLFDQVQLSVCRKGLTK
jgi:hypothetical protein